MSEQRPETMPDNDVIDLLLRQHELIRQLFDEVQVAAEVEHRQLAASRLVRLLAVHETIEEEIVHPFARRVLADGQQVVADRLQEEHDAKELLTELDGMDVTDAGFAPLLEQLRTAVLEHAGSEERYEFSALREQTSRGQRAVMAVAAKAAAAMAPTHPHPGVESATANLLLGPPTAIMDRARDVIRRMTS